MLPTVTGPLLGFRNKAKMTVTGTIDDPIIGIIDDRTSSQGREILDCPIHHASINEVLHSLKAFIRLSKLEPYQIPTRSGELKGIICFYSARSNEMYVRFILRSKEAISRIEKYAPELTRKHPFITSISANIQPIPHAILEGPEEFVLAGKGSVTHLLQPAGRPQAVELEINPRAFVQTNQNIAEQLYQTAANWVKEIKSEKFTELFCGQGAFSFFVKDDVQEALGIEINADAVAAANATAERTGAHHLRFKTADAASVANELKTFAPDTLLVNPPRKGLRNALPLIQSAKPKHLIYSSCSLDSFARDLHLLDTYQLVKLQIFDLFPHTEHFEILAHLLSKSM